MNKVYESPLLQRLCYTVNDAVLNGGIMTLSAGEDYDSDNKDEIEW